MPDIHLPRSVEIALGIATALLTAFAVFLLLMTIPPFGTRATNWALGAFGPEGASVSRAHTSLGALNTLQFQQFEAPGTAAVETGSVRVNVFGFLPGLAWVSRAEAETGFFQVNRREDGESGFSPPALRRLIDEVAIRDIEIRYTRREESKTVILQNASGSLRSGAVTVTAAGAGASLQFDGNADASTLGRLTGRLQISGDNFADFAWLAGFASPDTPPYDALADVAVTGRTLKISFLPETRIGDSDLSGPLEIRFGGETPVIDADLKSANLDFDDLGIIFGIPIGVGEGETVSNEQARARRILDESSRLIPDAEIDFTRLDAVDGDVQFEAVKVSDAIFDIRGLKLELTIDGRTVRAPVIQLDFGQGRLNSYVTLDGSQSPAMTTAEGQLTDVPFSNLAASPYLKGALQGEFKVEGAGNGFRDVAASLTGRASLWSENADLLAIVAEGAALDVGEVLLLINQRAAEEKYTPGRCTAISLALEDGIGTLDPAVIDTEDSLVVGKGTLNLKRESMDLSVRSEAKDVSFGTLVGDISVGGTFRNPEIDAISPETVLHIGIAALIGSLTTGGLAALPFIEPGGEEDAPCGELLAQAENVREQD